MKRVAKATSALATLSVRTVSGLTQQPAGCRLPDRLH